MGVSREGQREKERKKERKRWTFDKVRDRKKGRGLLEQAATHCMYRRPSLPRITIRKHLTKKTGLRDASGCGCELILDG